MIKEARGFGNTINEAKEDAIEKLGAKPEDDVQFETIAMYKKKVLGIFGGSKAEVRAYIETPDEKEKKPKNKKNKKSAEKKENTVKAEKKEPKTQETKIPDEFSDAVDESEIAPDSQEGMATAYLKSILENLGCSEIKLKIAKRENACHIFIDGKGLGAIIGRRGETLDALQYLTSLTANNGGGHFRVSLNVGSYREKREQALTALANRVAQQVIKSGRSRGLEPMNPYERRIIHTAIQELDGVTSSSVGDGSRRRVVIFPEGGDKRPPKSENRRPSNTVATAPTREPKKDSDIPLYGKIN